MGAAQARDVIAAPAAHAARAFTFVAACTIAACSRGSVLQAPRVDDSATLRFVDVAPAAPRAGAPTFVLLHGYGAGADDWLPFTHTLTVPPGTRFLFPEAPQPTVPPDGPIGGRAWWRIDLASFIDITRRGALPDLSRSSPPGLALARANVIAFLDDSLARGRVTRDALVLGGFSQGAMLALDVALHDDRPLRALVLLSGTIVSEDDWLPRLPCRRGLRVFISHSPDDVVLPFALADRLRHEMEAAGWVVTWKPFAGGHQIPADVVVALNGFLRAL